MMSIVGTVLTSRMCDVCGHPARLHDESGCDCARCDCWISRRRAEMQAQPAAKPDAGTVLVDVVPRLRIAS